MKQALDLERCKRGMKQVRVTGDPQGPQRQRVIEDAIAAILQHPERALAKGYLGVKNYSGFGDQREDHQYGFGPKYGDIVFSVGRSEGARKAGVALDADAVYFLEACRDFGTVGYEHNGHATRLNLDNAITRYIDIDRRRALLSDVLTHAQVESHETASAEVS